MELKYKLSQDEIEESLLCLNWKREGWFKVVNVCVLTIIALGSMWGYIKNTDRFFFLYFMAFSILLLFMLLYLQPLRRKRKAKQMLKKGDDFKVTLPKGMLKQGIESERVFTIQTQEETYCIPKRILKEEQMEEIRETIHRNAAKAFHMETRR